VVGLLASGVLAVFTVWMLALEYLDFPLGNRGLLFPEQRELAAQHRWVVLGFGSAVFLLTLIPLVNFTVMPAAVAGATRLVCADSSRFL
jgi:CysZ protein